MRKPIVGVMGPGAGATPAAIETAYEVGRQIALQGWVLLTGGRNTGVMHAANQGAKQANGLTIGILPGVEASEASSAVDIPILTGMSSARNHINILSSQVIIACGMGCGTASEIALALKAAKPVILLNVEPIAQAFFQQLTTVPVHCAANPTEAIVISVNLLNLELTQTVD
jgi:uncharacterized protein (TIGR00725 family)